MAVVVSRRAFLGAVGAAGALGAAGDGINAGTAKVTQDRIAMCGWGKQHSN
jgi:hypothetical protein